jgi:AraC-like DNA-binding protein
MDSGRAWARWYGGLHEASARSSRRRPVVRAKLYIDRQFVKPVPLEEMASEARLSKYHFVRAFRDIFRQTPHRYLVARRIARARELHERAIPACFYEAFSRRPPTAIPEKR